MTFKNFINFLNETNAIFNALRSYAGLDDRDDKIKKSQIYNSIKIGKITILILLYIVLFLILSVI